LTLTLEKGEWSASRPSRFTTRKRAPGTHWIGGWMGLRAGLDAVETRKIPSPTSFVSNTFYMMIVQQNRRKITVSQIVSVLD
jgi:hypothetical protein